MDGNGGGGGGAGVDGRRRKGRQRGREVGRGRPRTRRIIARVILPRCARLSFSFPIFPPCLLASCFLPRAHAYVRTYVRTYVCTRELASACERSPSVRRSRSRGGRERGSRGKEWKRLRKRSGVSRTLDEADATPTERHPREKPSPRSPRLLHLLPSSPPRSLPFFCPGFSPLARASFASFRSRPRNAPTARRAHGFFFEPDCTLHIYRYRILRISTGILRHVLPSHQIIVRLLAGRLVAQVSHKSGESGSFHTNNVITDAKKVITKKLRLTIVSNRYD